jgi:hypothetical protein
MLIESVAAEAFRSNTLERLDVTLTSTPLDRPLPGSPTKLPFSPLPTVLSAKLAGTHRRRPHDVIYSSHT